MVQSTGTGIGRALRGARLRLGKSLEEASRETRVRSDYLGALEREDFGVLRGDVYVRGFLRSYSRYLGLNPDRVVGAYERIYGVSTPAPAPVEQSPGVGPTEAVVLTGGQRRPSWLLAALAAAIVLAAAAAIGLFSSRADVPPQAADRQPAPAVENAPTVSVELIAGRDVDVQVRIDGGDRAWEHLEEGEALQFEGQDRIDIRISDGGAVRMGVNGTDPARPGPSGVPYEGTFFPSDFREEPSASQATPSP